MRSHREMSTTRHNDINERCLTIQILFNHIAYPQRQHFVLPLGLPQGLTYLKLLKENLPKSGHHPPAFCALNNNTNLVSSRS